MFLFLLKVLWEPKTVAVLSIPKKALEFFKKNITFPLPLLEVIKIKISDGDEIVVNAKVLAKVLGISDRQIRNLYQEGIAKKNAAGRYLLVESVREYIARLRVEVASKEPRDNVFDNEIEDLNTERAKHEHIKRQIAELKLYTIQGKLYEADKIELVMTNMLTNFKQKLLGVPAKMAKKLVGKTRVEINELLTDEMQDVLLELSDYDPEAFFSEQYIEQDEDDEG